MAAARIRVLLIEDNAGDARLIERMLTEPGAPHCMLEWTDDLPSGAKRLAEWRPDVVLLDLGLPGSSGLATLRRFLEQAPSVPALVVLSGLNDEDVALDAVKSGAQDYLVKGRFDQAMLVRAMRYAIERSQARDELELRVAERTAELAQTVSALHGEIADRERTEQLLRKREQEFRTLAENSPDMVIRYDRDCRRFYVNPAYQRETADAAGAAECPEAQWQRETPALEYRMLLQQVMDSGEATEIFMRGHGQDGRPAHYAFHVVPEANPDGQVVGALAIGRNVTALKETQQLLRDLAARSEAVREQERKALTREIHDEMGQYLSALRLGVSLIGLQFGAANPGLDDKTRALVELIDSSIKVVRNVVASLRPAALDMGIVSALEWLVEEFTGRSTMPCSLRVDAQMALDDKRATEVFRIVQESLTNISRHAQASAVRIVLDRFDDHYLLEVRDNGRGFDPAKRKLKSFGLIGLRERALVLGGEARVTSAPGQGTVVKVSFPISIAMDQQ